MAACNVKDAMEAHSVEIMKIPGVVGVYTGVLEDGTPCIKVMVAKKTQELEKQIPHYLEGCPVSVEETGEIQPYSN